MIANRPSSPTTLLLSAPPGDCLLRIVTVEPVSLLPETTTELPACELPSAGDAIDSWGGFVSRMYTTSGDGWPSLLGVTSAAAKVLGPSTRFTAPVLKCVVEPTSTSATCLRVLSEAMP